MEHEPKVVVRQPRSTSLLVLLGLVFLAGATFMAFTAMRISAGDAHDAATRNARRAEVAEQKLSDIQTAQVTNVAVAGCRAQYQDRLNKAIVLNAVVFDDLVASLFPGHQPLTDADARIADAETQMQGAQADLDKYNDHPIVPCPIPPAPQ